jgi:hypothetical protein
MAYCLPPPYSSQYFDPSLWNQSSAVVTFADLAGYAKLSGPSFINGITVSGGITTDGLTVTNNYIKMSPITIGNTASTTQGSNSIFIGDGGNTNQGNNAIAIGQYSGQGQGSSAISVGYLSGQHSQASTAVAMGENAGNSGQAAGAVAIGVSAGASNQHTNSIAIGNGAGFSVQGADAIAIGYQAGNTSQGANSIVLNATGSALTTNIAGCIVAPVRQVAGTTPVGLAYDTTNHEIIACGFPTPYPTKNSILIAKDYGSSQPGNVGTYGVRCNLNPNNFGENDYYVLRVNIGLNYNPQGSLPNKQNASWGLASTDIQVFPYRCVLNWCVDPSPATNPPHANINNFINGGSGAYNYYYQDNTWAPNGREFFSINPFTNGTANFYLSGQSTSGTSADIVFWIGSPGGWTDTTTLYNYDISIELINPGIAAASQIQSFGFPNNFSSL